MYHREMLIFHTKEDLMEQERISTKWLEIRFANSTTTKHLKCPHGPNHCKELIKIIKMEFWFTQFGVRTLKLWPLQD